MRISRAALKRLSGEEVAIACNGVIAPISARNVLMHPAGVTPEEKNQLQVIVLTLADPKGNWNYAWQRLCDAAGMDSNKYKPPFKTHPFPESQSEPRTEPGS